MNKLMQKALSIAQRIRGEKNVLAIYLFGSVAEGSVTPLSDIDIAVVLSPYDTQMVYEVMSYCSPIIDISIFNDLPPFMKFAVMSKGKLLYVKDQEKLDEMEIMAMKEYHEHVPLYEFFEVKT
jgi:predicted nucleotidyltransferase